MNRLKICRIFFVAVIVTILFSMPLTIVRAQSEGTPGPTIAFADSTGELNFQIGDIEQTGFSVSLINRSDSPVTVSVLILGVDEILQSDAGAQPLALEKGEDATVKFTLRTGDKVTEIINSRAALTGYLIFSSSAGGFVYKTVTITMATPPPPPAEIKAPEASEIILLNESDGTIAFDWDALENGTMVFPVLNTGKYPAYIEALLYLPELTSDQPPVIQPIRFLGVLSLPIEPLKTSNIQFKLDEPPSEPKKYDGILILTDAGGAWSILKKVELYVPSAGQQPAAGAGLSFLADDKASISIDYNRLKRGEPVEIGLVNEGKGPVTIASARMVLPDLIDRKGNKIELQTLDFQPLEIPASKIGFITIRMDGSAPAAATAASPAADVTLKFTGTPQSGTYGGYLVLATNSDPAIIKKAVSLEVSTVNSALPTAIDKIAAGIQVFFQNLFHRQFRFGVAEWAILAVLAAIALAGLIWVGQRIQLWWWNASGKLGPVYIENIPKRKDLRASLRHHLAHCGVMSKTAVPNTSIGESAFIAVVAKSKIPEAAFIEKILSFLQKILGKKPGYVVTAIVSGGASTTGNNAVTSGDAAKTKINIQIRLAHNDQVKWIETLEGNDPEDAIKNAAYYIYYQLTCQKAALARIPKWSRFPTLGSFQQYKRAEELKKEGKYPEAIEQYRCASKKAPFNALLRLGWGDAYELSGQFLDALEVYLETASVWPYLYSFWFRIAVDFSYVNEWWEKSEEKKRNSIFRLAKSCSPIKYGDFWGGLYPWRHPTTPRDISWKSDDTNWVGERKEVPTKEDFLEQSQNLYYLLNKEIRTQRAIKNWGRAFLVGGWYSISKKTEYITGLSRYLWRYIPLFPWMRETQLQRMIELAFYIVIIHRARTSTLGKICHEINLQGDSIECFISHKAEALAKKCWNLTEVYYDAACVYARLISYVKDQAKKVAYGKNAHKEFVDKEYAFRKAALKYIKKAARDPSLLGIKWAKTDPDLMELYVDPEFRALFDIPDKVEQQKEEDKEKTDKSNMIQLLQKGIVQQQKDWKKAHGKKISAAGLIAEADYQVKLWGSLETLSGKPTDGELQEAFLKLVMQKGETEIILPRSSELSQDDITKLDLDTLNKCLKFIQGSAKSQREVWEERKADSKLFLEHDKVPVTDVWALWQQAEKAQWVYLEKKIDPILEDKPSKKKSDKSPKRPARQHRM